MAFTPVPGSIFGFSGIGLAVILALFASNDPPVVIWDGSIHARVSFWHIWHRVEDSGQSYSAVRKPDNPQIVITDDQNNILLACNASQWVLSLYTEKDRTNPVAQLCTNHQCDARAPADQDGNIYFNATRSGKRWRHTKGIEWWEIEYEDDDMHITKVGLTTAASQNGSYACPASWPNESSRGVPNYNWNVRIW